MRNARQVDNCMERAMTREDSFGHEVGEGGRTAAEFKVLKSILLELELAVTNMAKAAGKDGVTKPGGAIFDILAHEK
eukprot:1075102-Pyramimonas_sp.AAC.1